MADSTTTRGLRGQQGASGDSPKRPATIRDVAAVAGVSHQTVARFLNGDSSVKALTRERITAAIAQLNYRPNEAARSLKTGKTKTIAALCIEIDDPGPARTMKGAIHAAREAGFILDTIALDTGDEDELNAALRTIQNQRFDGLISLDYTDQLASALAKASLSVPHVMGGGDDAIPDGPAAGIPSIIDHLAGLGHQRILHVAGPATWPAARRRIHAFNAAVAARELESAGIVYGDWTPSSGFESIRALGPDLDFTAVVAANDRMALGVIRALNLIGLRVPEDISVTGIDDMPDAAYFSPPLTTLRVDFEEVGRTVFLSLLASLEGRPIPPPPTDTAPLVVRESTGPRRG